MKLKHREIIGILSVILGLLILLCLISYNPVEEPTISKNVVIDNWMGIMGVYVSHFFIKEFMGIGAYIFPILLMLWGVWIFLNLN
jgi:S-DNA-T family DNA segregation ATPase FtsK/SpoIIIE